MSEAKIVLSAVDQTKAAFESAKKGLTDLQTKAVAVTGVLGALGITAYITDLAAGIRASVGEWDELGKAAQRAGFASAQGMAEFQFAAKLAGVDSAGFEQAVGKLSEKMADAAGGGKQAMATFAAMGVKIKDAAGNLRSTEAVLSDLAKAFAGWKDGPEKTALALDLFSKAGKQMIPLLNGGADGLEKLTAEFRQLRGALDDGTVKASEQFNDNITRLETAAGGLKRELAEKLLPGLNQITEAMVEQAKKGSLLLAVWTGMKEFASIGFNTDALGQKITGSKAAGAALQSKGAQLDLLLQAQANGGDSEPLRAEIAKVRAELEKLQRTALAASGAVKSALNPNYRDNTALTTGDFARMDRASGSMTSAPIVPKDDGKAAATTSEYDSLIKRIKEKTAAEDAELQKGRALTEFEKFEAKVLADVDNATQKLTVTQMLNVDALLQDAKAKNAANEQSAKRIKLMQAEAAFIMETADEIAAAHTADSKAREQVGLAILAESAALADAGQLLDLEGKLIDSTDARRQIALDHLRIELKLRKDLWDLDHNNAFADNEGSRQIERQRLLDNAELAKQQASQRAGLDEFQKGWQSVDQTAHDVFTNIFEGGSDVFKRLGQTLKASLLDILYQMTAKKWVFQIYANVTGGAAGGLAGAAGMGAVGDSVVGSGLGGLFSSGAGGMLAGTSLGGFGAGLGATMTNGLIGGFGANMANIGGMLSGGSYGMALGAAAPYLLPLIAGVALLAGRFKGETRSGGQYSDGTFLQGPSGGEINGAASRGAITATIDSINGTLKALGSTSTLANLQSGFESSKNGKGFAYAGGQLSTGQIFGQGVGGRGFENRRGSMTPEEAAAAFGEELKQATLQALQAANVPGLLGDWLRSLGDIDALSGGALDAALARIQKALSEKTSLEEQFYALTHTEQENLTVARQKERDALDESNRALYDQVAALTDQKVAVEAAAQKQREIDQQRYGLETQAIQLQGNVAELRRRELAALDPANRALQEYIYTLQDAATEAAKALAVANERTGLETTLLQVQGNTAELRRRELTTLDPSNRALQQRIWALQDEQAITAKVTQDIKDYTADVRQQADAAKSALMGAYQQESSALQQAIDQHQAYATSLRAARDAMMIGADSPLSASQRTAEALRQYNDTSARAQGGDADALGKLQGAGAAYLEALKNSAGKSSDFAAGFARVAAGLTITAAKEDAAASIAQHQLAVMNAQMTALGLLNDTTKQGFDALLSAYVASRSHLDQLTGGGMAGGSVTGSGSIEGGITWSNGVTATAAQLAAAHAESTYLVGADNAYLSLLGRAPDLGARDWIQGVYQQGGSLDDIRRTIMGSSEYASLPHFAGGGLASGRVVVGENGPELLDLATPGRVYSAGQTKDILGGGAGDVVAALNAWRAESRVMTIELITRLQNVDLKLKKFDGDGMPPVRK